MDTQAERRRKDEQVRATINQKLVETGEKGTFIGRYRQDTTLLACAFLSSNLLTLSPPHLFSPDKLKELLRNKLIECGWRDELKAYCKDVIKNKGLEKITVEELVAEITPRGRATVPDAIKAELLQRIRKFLQAN